MLDPAQELTSVAEACPPPPELPPAPLPRRLLPFERTGALMEVALCSGFPTQILVAAVLTGLGLQPRDAGGEWSSRFIVAMSLMDMVLVLGLVLFFLRTHREPVRDFLLGQRRPAREVLLGLALIPAAFVLVVLVLGVILAVAPQLHNVPVNPFQRMLQTPTEAAVFAVVVMLAGGLREEVQRAFIIRRFEQHLGGGVLGIVLFSAVFGLGHVDQGYAAAIATGLLGAAWGLVYWTRRSVIAPVVSHAGFNLVQLVNYVSLTLQ